MEAKNMFPTSFHSFSVIFHLRISFEHKIWSPTLETYEVFEIEKGGWKIEKKQIKLSLSCWLKGVSSKHGSIQIWTLVGGAFWTQRHIFVPVNIDHFYPFQVCGLWNIFWRHISDRQFDFFGQIYREVCADWRQRSSLVSFWTCSRDYLR